jgi:TolA-binding protein
LNLVFLVQLLQYFLPIPVVFSGMRKSGYAFLFFLLPFLPVEAQDQLSRNRSDELYRKGLELIQHRNYGAARKVMEDFLAIAELTDIRRTEATYQLAFCALQLGHADAEKRMQDFIDRYPAHPRAQLAFFELGNFFYQEKNYKKAILYYSKTALDALTRDEQAELRFRWGYSLFAEKKLSEALVQFNYVKVQSGAYAVAASYYAGFIAYTQGNYEAALPDLRRAEAQSSYAQAVPVLIAGCYYHMRQFDELLSYYQKIQGQSSSIQSFADISAMAADALYFKKDYSSAVTAYESYLKSAAGKASPATLFRAGHAHYLTGQDNRAVELLRTSAVASDTVSYYASFYLGIVYVRQGSKSLAKNAFDFARKHPHDLALAEEATFNLCKVTYELGQADEAIRELENFAERFPDSRYYQEVRELLAQAYVNGNNYNKAITYIESLPSRNASVREAYQKATYLKGTELFNKEDYTGAIQYFEKSLADAPRTDYAALAALWCAEALSILKRTEEAMAYYQRVLKWERSAPQDIVERSYYGLGYIYFNNRQYDQALNQFKQFISRANRSLPAFKDALIRLADCYYATRAYNEAITHYNRARQLAPAEDDYLLFQLGVVYGIIRNYAESRNHFNMLLSQYPRSTYREEAIYQRAQFDIEQGNYPAAAEGLSQLIREGSGSRFLPYAYLRRAAVYYNLRQYDRTVADYASILQLFPTHPVARQALPFLQEALNLTGRAQEFDRYLALYKQANPDDRNLESIEFERAKNLYFEQQYAQAVALLQSYIENYPNSVRLGEARFYLAESFYRQQQYDRALPLYQDLQRNPSPELSLRVAQRIAEVYFRQGKYEQAIPAYRQLERMATSKRELYIAWSGLMESFYYTGQYDSVTTYAQHIIQRGNINAGAVNKATLFMGKAAMARGDFDTAKDEFLATLNTARDEYGAEAKYRLGEIFYQTGQHRQCYETLISLNTDFAAYEDWVGRSYLLLADNFLAMNDAFNAKATLQSLIDRFPLAHIREEARKKLQDITRAEQQEKQRLSRDTTDNR